MTIFFLWFIFAYADELNSDFFLHFFFFFPYFVHILTFPASQPSSAVRLADANFNQRFFQSAVRVSFAIFLNLLSIR